MRSPHGHERPRVVLLRGHQANAWHLRPWRHLTDRFEVQFLETRRNWFDTSSAALERVPVRALRDLLPLGRMGDLAVRVPGDRYLGLAKRLQGADIVHSQDLVFWYSAQAAALKRELGYKLVLTVWETLPLLQAYRNVRTRHYRRIVLQETDLFLCATERAKTALLLEGAPEGRVAIAPPGVDDELFRPAASPEQPDRHLVVSVGRLVWEKGHQDVLRALALLRRKEIRLLVIGAGPEERRLKRYAEELGVSGAVAFRTDVPYAQMPETYRDASCLVLASLPTWGWEEQFGMVLVEAMAAGLPIIASASGAIPAVVPEQASCFNPGDWIGLADTLRDHVLSRPPGQRIAYDPRLVERYSSTAAAERLAAAYHRVLRA